MIEKIKKSFENIHLPDEITWLSDDWMVWSAKGYYECCILELEKNPNERRKKELIHDLRKLYKALRYEKETRERKEAEWTI